MDTTEIQSITRDYYKQLYANKMDNLEEINKFLEMNTLSKLNQEETENMNRPVTSNENEPVMNTLPAGLPSWHNGRESARQCRGHWFNP